MVKVTRRALGRFVRSVLPGRLSLAYRLHRDSRLKIYVEEVNRIGLVDAGVDSGTPWVALRNGTRLFGQLPKPSERKRFQLVRSLLPECLSEETFLCAIDVATRYGFPHALPGHVLPYPRRMRATLAWKYRETIWDLPLPRSRILDLVDRFEPRAGETFVELGSYIGFGTTRLAQMVGSAGRVVTVEAAEATLGLVRRNLDENRLTHAEVVHSGVWNEPGRMRFYETGRGVNSLLSEVIPGEPQAGEIRVDTVDNILASREVSEVDLLSVTLNGAEPEAIEGMAATLARSPNVRLSLAGWYERHDGSVVWEKVEPILRDLGLEVLVGPEGRVLAWRE